MSESIPIDEILVNDRFRKEIGDVSTLARSIEEVGLLHPVVISESRELIAGYRRIEAYRLLGRDTIPCRVVPLHDLRLGEVTENTQRKGFTVSEMVAINRTLGPGVRSEAEVRIKAGEPCGKLPQGKSRDIVGSYAGVSGRTLEKAEAIVEAAERQPDLYQSILEKVNNDTISIDRAFKIVTIKEKQQRNKENGSPPLPEGVYDVVYADPPWRYDYNGSLRGKADIHYPTLKIDEITAIPIDQHIAEDAALLLWSTNAFLETALKLIHDWGFTYKTCFVWVKDRIGVGFWLRNQHELLLLGVKGHFPSPADEDRQPSVIEAPYTEHSSKPEVVYGIIEKMWPRRRYLELYARNTHPGWASWGNEVKENLK